ncbi:hypothetical protein [Paenibacillus stellifer]|uniref:hypothetical protein n=1 Tax=Paenibacillus stellifer TaxID=169760 RepID=UPI001470650A|nr:hypothetical protein [Paenibacillus stellifer]
MNQAVQSLAPVIGVERRVNPAVAFVEPVVRLMPGRGRLQGPITLCQLLGRFLQRSEASGSRASKRSIR